MRSTTDARRSPLHHLLHFGQRGHAGITWRRHRQRAMRRSAFDGPLRSAIREKTIDESGGKRIAAADAVENLQIDSGGGLEKLAVAPRDRAPIVASGGARDAQSR